METGTPNIPTDNTNNARQFLQHTRIGSQGARGEGHKSTTGRQAQHTKQKNGEKSTQRRKTKPRSTFARQCDSRGYWVQSSPRACPRSGSSCTTSESWAHTKTHSRWWAGKS